MNLGSIQIWVPETYTIPSVYSTGLRDQMIKGMGSYDSIRISSIPAFPHIRFPNIRRVLRFRRSPSDPRRSIAGQLSSSVMDPTWRRVLSGRIDEKGREHCVWASTNSHTARPLSTNPTNQNPTVRFRNTVPAKVTVTSPPAPPPPDITRPYHAQKENGLRSICAPSLQHTQTFRGPPQGHGTQSKLRTLC